MRRLPFILILVVLATGALFAQSDRSKDQGSDHAHYDDEPTPGSLESGLMYFGGGALYANHAADSFDGASYYVGENESFVAPLWENAMGFYATAGLGFRFAGSTSEFHNSISYSRVSHEGSHTEGTFTGHLNDVSVSASYVPIGLFDMFYPIVTGALSWTWLNVDDGVYLDGGGTETATFMGMAGHIGAGLHIEPLDLVRLEVMVGYRILDYVSAAYDGFSAHLGEVGNGWYVRIGAFGCIREDM